MRTVSTARTLLKSVTTKRMSNSAPFRKRATQVVHAAVSDAVKERRLWLVFGTDSVFGEAPTTLHLDGEATIYPPPEPLAVADLLPPNLPAAWTKDAEPRTTPTSLYAAIKAARGKPWPEVAFSQHSQCGCRPGLLRPRRRHRPALVASARRRRALVIRQGKPVIVEPSPIPPGRKFSNSVTLAVGEVQSLADEISDW